MSTFDILKILWRIRKRGIVSGVLEIFKPKIEEFGRDAKNAVENLAYLSYEMKSIEYDLDNINEMKEDLDIEINNVKRSFSRLKMKTS